MVLEAWADSLAEWLGLPEERPVVLALPGLPLAVSCGDAWAAVEIQVLTVGGIALLVAIGALAYQVRRCPWLPHAAQQALLCLLWLACTSGPFAVLHWRGQLLSRVSNFTLTFLAVLSSFRMIELLAGTGPKGFDASMKNFVVYFASPAQVLFDDEAKFRRTQPGTMLYLARRMLTEVALQVFFLSLGRATNFVPFLGDPSAKPLHMPLLGMPYALPAMHLQACNVYTMLSCAMVAHRLPLALCGVETLEAMHHPLWASTSVREFWGRRWNMIIHGLMKRTFFSPQVAHWGKAGAHFGGVLAFLMSALLHEYMWLIVAWFDAGSYVFGGPILFFLAQYALGAVESALAKTRLGEAVGGLPRPLLVVGTTLSILPFAPLFLHGIRDQMADCARVFPTIVPVGQAGPGLYLLPTPSPATALACLAVTVLTAVSAYRYGRRGALRAARAAVASLVPLASKTKQDL